MRLEIVIRVSEEKVVVEVPERGWRKEFANCMTLSEQGTVLFVGQTEKELRDIAQQKNLIWRDDLKFLPIYDVQNFDIELISQSLQFFTWNAQQETSSREKIDLKLSLPENYPSSLGNLSEQFSYLLEEHLNLQSLEINGKVVGWSTWQRKLVRFHSFFPLLVTFFFFLKLLPKIYPVNPTWISTIFAQMAEPWNTLDTVINFMSTFVLLGLLWGGATVLLLVIYRFFVPKTLFLIHQASFPSRGGVGEKWLIWLAERLLVDTPIFSPKTS